MSFLDKMHTSPKTLSFSKGAQCYATANVFQNLFSSRTPAQNKVYLCQLGHKRSASYTF